MVAHQQTAASPGASAPAARKLILQRRDDAALTFRCEVLHGKTLLDASLRIGKAGWRAFFAVAEPGDVRIEERGEAFSASLWFGRTAFELEDNEVELVRDFFGLPAPAKAGEE